MEGNEIRGDVSGHVVQARRIDQVVLAGPRLGPPRQMVAPTPHFIDREPILAGLAEQIRLALTEQRLGRIVLTGLLGSGRTSVAAKASAEHRELFPDGSLFISLGSAERDDLIGPAGTLRAALADLGVPWAEIPADPAEQAARFRTLVAARRMLIVLTDVRGEAEIQPFLVHSPGSVLIVITEGTGPWIRRGSFFPLEVAGLSDEHAAELLRSLAGAAVDELDPALLAAVLAGCHGNPTLIGIVAGLFHEQRHWTEINLRAFVAQGLDALAPEDQELITRGIRLAYERLERDAARAYLLLGLQPGPVVAVADLLALLELPEFAARRVLDKLVRANLVTEDAERLRLDRSVWWHARAQARADLPLAERGEIVAKILDRVLRSTVDKDARLSRRPRINPLYQPYLSVALADGEERAGLLAELERQRETLRLAVFQAEDYRLDELTWQLCEALWSLYHLHGHFADWLATHELGLAAARWLEHAPAIMRMLSQLGSAHFATGDHAKAEQEFREALGIAGELDGPAARIQVQSSHEWLGKIAWKRGDVTAALDCFTASWEAAYEAPAEEQPRMLALLRLQRARLFNSAERFADALRELAEPEIAGFFDAAGESDNRAKVLLAKGEALIGLGEAEAVQVLTRALAIFTEDGSLRSQLTVLKHLISLTGNEEYRERVSAIHARLGIAD